MEVRSRSLKKCVSEVGVENIGFRKAKYFSFGCKTPKNKLVVRSRFKCDHELFCEYKNVIDDYVREGIVERTSCDSLLDSQGFYLPHHAVIRSDKTTSHIRIVFDGSAHEDGQSSLNQSLYTGPNLHPNILELLLCFSKSPVAFTADVKSAFLQIELDFRDRDFTRFFWTDNLNKEPYVLNFRRILFGLRASPYLLAATLKHHFKKYREQYPHTFELLNSSIYVDDLICDQNDVPDALRTTLSACKYSVTQACYCANGEVIRNNLICYGSKKVSKTESSETSAIDLRPPTKVLGLAWDPENDLIYFDPKDLLKFMSRRGESKRFILSVVGRIFDPIGILGPFVIKLKCLLQELWTLGVEWDSELPPKLRHKWQQWSSEAEGLTEIKIPRFYLGRVAPLKSLTLPRLELTAALLSARLAKQVSSCLKFDANIYYWTDSLISYYWIRGDSSAFKPYIKNRVQEIQLLSDPMQWGHCSGKDNPADLLSRGTSAVKLAQNELWWHGPPWLKLTPDHWPNRHRDILDSELCSERIRTSEHERIGHCGVSATLTQLRKKYWIPKGRQLVKTMIRICLVCKKYSAKPADQLSGQLPRDRITQSPPFQVVGIDFTVTRAVHLELVSDMSKKCFLLALRRFLARRGNCKDPLRKILGRALLTFEELSTILSEVEVIFNHRPLTYVENDPGEPEPLTPAHFLES
ncbi:integrase catalytic domain-containing protein [Trichonephila clavipes]|nr:integrase catalytic domain-containing protein [Trichonephila clavipes]